MDYRDELDTVFGYKDEPECIVDMRGYNKNELGIIVANINVYNISPANKYFDADDTSGYLATITHKELKRLMSIYDYDDENEKGTVTFRLSQFYNNIEDDSDIISNIGTEWNDDYTNVRIAMYIGNAHWLGCNYVRAYNIDIPIGDHYETLRRDIVNPLTDD